MNKNKNKSRTIGNNSTIYPPNEIGIKKDGIYAKGDKAIKEVTSSSLIFKIAAAVVIAAGGFYAIKNGSKTILNWFKSHHDIKKANAKSESDINEYTAFRSADGKLEEVKAEQRIKVQDSLFAHKIQEYKEKKKVDDESYERRIKNDLEKKKELQKIARGKIMKATMPMQNPDKELKKFNKKFLSRHTMPKLHGILHVLMKGVPVGYETAMLMFLINSFAALCFSKVRATFKDGKTQAANLILMIIAPPAYGKGKFLQMFNTVFKRVIERDNEMLKQGSDNNRHTIIQTISDGITYSKFFDLLADNDEVHMFQLNSELQGLLSSLRKNNKISLEVYLKAYDNEVIDQENKSKSAKQGRYKVFLNSAYTGTPSDCKMLLKQDKNGGLLSRIVFCDIPKPPRKIPELLLPHEEELEEIRNQIDLWRELYCYRMDDNNNDIPAEECEIDLNYVREPLEEWLLSQWDKAQREKDEPREIGRIRAATNAFRCAMVAHLMYGCPGDDDKTTQNDVVELALYIAEYCVEKYVFMVAMQNVSSERRVDGTPNNKKVSNTRVAQWLELHNEGWSYREIGEEFGFKRDYVKTTISRYRKK